MPRKNIVINQLMRTKKQKLRMRIMMARSLRMMSLTVVFFITIKKSGRLKKLKIMIYSKNLFIKRLKRKRRQC